MFLCTKTSSSIFRPFIVRCRKQKNVWRTYSSSDPLVLSRRWMSHEKSWSKDDEHFLLAHVIKSSRSKGEGQERGRKNKVHVSETVLREFKYIYGENEEDVSTLFSSKKFLLLGDERVIKTAEYLNQRGISLVQLHRIPWILLESEESLREKFPRIILPCLFETYSEGLGFCHFTKEIIYLYERLFEAESADYPNHRNRIYYLAERLQLPVDQLTEKIAKAKRLITRDMEQIERTIQILEKYNVWREDILEDLWIFYHNNKQIEERLQVARDVGLDRIKLWLCRCPQYMFNRTCEKHLENKRALGKHENVEEYLAERLEVAVKTAEDIIMDYPFIRKLNPVLLERKINLIYSLGFTPHHLRSSLYILRFSEAKLRERWMKLQGDNDSVSRSLQIRDLGSQKRTSDRADFML